MNKQKIEQKLEEIIYNNSFDGQYGTEYYGDRIAKEAFNLALDIAAENAEAFIPQENYTPNGVQYCEAKINKESILKYKL